MDQKTLEAKIYGRAESTTRGPKADAGEHLRMFREYYDGVPMHQLCGRYRKSNQRIHDLRKNYGLPTRQELLLGRG